MKLKARHTSDEQIRKRGYIMQNSQGNNALLIIATILAFAVAMGIGRFAYTPILTTMLEAQVLTEHVAAKLAAYNYLGYLLGAIICTFVHYTRTRIFLLKLSLFVSATSTLAMGFTEIPILWVILRLLSGVASAGIFLLASGIALDQLFKQNKPQLAGWLYSGIGVGIALSGAIVLSLQNSVTWQYHWISLGIISLVFILPCWFFMARPDQVMTHHHEETEEKTPYFNLPLLLLITAYFLEGTGYIISGTFLVNILHQIPELNAISYWSWVIVGVAAIPSSIFWAYLGQRLSYSRALILAYAIQAVGIALPALSTHPIAGIIAAVTFGGTFIGIVMLTFKLAKQLATSHTTFIISFATAVYSVGQVIGPLLADYLTRQTGDIVLPLVAAGCIVAGGMLLLLVGKLCHLFNPPLVPQSA